MKAVMSKLADHARDGNIVLMAGAGVSTPRPSALPGWKPLNAAILRALSSRLESALEWRNTRLGEWISYVDAERKADRFPPEYQAQVIEEMCGDRYFRALQALDVDAVNAGHEGIAALAAAGALKAVVTTNFDRLIEHSLDRRGVKCEVAFDDQGYANMAKRLRAGSPGPLPVIKIHGCVSKHRSMIDTLKQRVRGRSRALQSCLDELMPGYWVYLGFSAADLEGNPHYLGLAPGAPRSAGATYVAYPGNAQLGKGAQTLMQAYGNRGDTVVAEVPAVLQQLGNAIGAPATSSDFADDDLGLAEFRKKLDAWAEELPPAAAGLCLAATLEAVGQGEAAVRVLDRLVRNELYDQRATPDFRALQLHYGRLGGAWGRFVAVPDMNGEASNASVETFQSLARIVRSELGFPASVWLAPVYLWRNDGASATRLAKGLLHGFVTGGWDRPAPRSDEDMADGWISAAQVLVINEYEETELVGTAEAALQCARLAGDVVRLARIAALHLLALGKSPEDVPARMAGYRAQFDEAARVGDGFALGMRELALGRWHVGAGGLALAATLGSETVAQRALAHLQAAVSYFEKQGMDPWVLFSLVQQAKAYADLRNWDESQACIDVVVKGLQRFPILEAHVHETGGQMKRMYGDPGAEDSFRAAVEAAEASGLDGMAERLQFYLKTSSASVDR